MEKKTGNECTAKEPAAPTEPVEAANSDPGEVSTAPTREHTAASGTLGSSTITAMDPLSHEETQPDETHWISIELKDDQGNPVPNEQYRVTLPDGSVRSGYTDQEGKARVEGIPEGGQADINFPRIHGDEWDPA